MQHECKQGANIERIEASSVRVHKELYEGREGRQPVLVRVDRCERVIDKLVYVSTALLVAVLLGSGTLVFKSVFGMAR